MAEIKITVRGAQRGDIGTIVEFNAAMALETEAKTLPLADLRRGVAAVFDEPQRGFYCVAEVDGRTAGCLMITYEWSDWRNGDWWWIQSVYVHPDFRRCGVFRALYAHVEAAARETAGVIGLRLYVEKENGGAQQTYTSLGMREADYHMYAITLDSRIAGSR